MRKRIIHAVWAARQSIYRAYDRHCEGGGLGLLSPVLWGTALVCLVTAPWHPGNLLVGAPAAVLALAAGPHGKGGRPEAGVRHAGKYKNEGI